MLQKLISYIYQINYNIAWTHLCTRYICISTEQELQISCLCPSPALCCEGCIELYIQPNMEDCRLITNPSISSILLLGRILWTLTEHYNCTQKNLSNSSALQYFYLQLISFGGVNISDRMVALKKLSICTKKHTENFVYVYKRNFLILAIITITTIEIKVITWSTSLLYIFGLIKLHRF